MRAELGIGILIGLAIGIPVGLALRDAVRAWQRAWFYTVIAGWLTWQAALFVLVAILTTAAAVLLMAT